MHTTGLENLLITARDGVNSWAGSLAYGNRISWFNNNTSSFFLKGACLAEFDPMSPRQMRAKFREVEKIAKEQYKKYKNNRTSLPTWITLFFELFDKSRYLSTSASTTPTNINDTENNLNDVSTPCASTATLAHRNYDGAVQQSNASNVSAAAQKQDDIPLSKLKAMLQQQQKPQEQQIVIAPYTQMQGNTIQEAVAEAILDRPDASNINQGTSSSRSVEIEPRSPSPTPPLNICKTSDDKNILHSEQQQEQQQVSTNNNNKNNKSSNQFNPTSMQPPVITIRPFTQIFADAMMVRQRLNASLTLNNNDDVRFYKNCLDAIESEIDTYKYLQIAMRHVHNNNNNNSGSNNSNSG